MKKITIKIFLLMFLLGTYIGISQTLNQNASWPNTNWTVTGSFNTNPLAFEADPTTTSNFAFDDDDAGNGSDDNIAAESPVIDLTAAHTAGETWISISGNYVYNRNSGDILQIEYWDADASTWNIIGAGFLADTAGAPLNNFCTATSEPYTTDIINIVGFTATQLSGFRYRIYYDDTVGGPGFEWGFCFDSPTITSATPPACPDPTALTASNIDDTSADLAWTETGSASAWNIELVDVTAAGTATGTATNSGVTNPFNITGLTPFNDYEYYVQADCGGDGTSAWVGPFAFTTACASFSAPYLEDFEAFTTATSAFLNGNCWSATGGAYFWESAPGTDTGSGGTGPDPSITTGNYFYTEASGGTTGNTTDLVSPLVDLTALTAPSLTFNYHMFGGQIGTLDVLVNGTTNVWSLSGEQQTSATAPWELAVIDLTAYTGQTIYVTFRATSAGTFEGDIAIDNVSFDELPACPAPNALTVTTITDTTAELGWTENGTATVWDIEIVDVTAGGTPTGTPTVSGVSNPYTVMGLTQDNDYTFYVRADCGGGTTSSWVGPFAFTTLESCPTPSGLTATSISDADAILGWTENGVATSWNIELVDITAAGTATGTPTVTGVTNPYTISGLASGNDYQFYVQADCGVDGTSNWAGPFSFTTAVSVALTCIDATYVDSGGAGADYTNDELIIYTICPDTPGDGVEVEFTFFSTENDGASACYDGLTIYNGADLGATTIDPPGGGTIWCWDRDDTVPGGTGDLQGLTIASTDPSGCLTFVFTSDGSVVREGWEAIITCNALSVTEVENPAAFTYYPNPVKNTLTLDAQNNIENVVMYNVLGQEVLNARPNTINSDLDMSSLDAGAYFVKVTIAGITKVIRIIRE